MADTKFSGLPAVTAVTATDEFALNQSGSKKATSLLLKAFVQDGINIRNYAGVVGDGSNDDTTGIQNAINAAVTAHKSLIWPAPNSGGFWKITSTLLVPTGTPSGQNWMGIIGDGAYTDIRWRGSNTDTVFQLIGSHNTSFRNLHVYVDLNHDIKVWDLDTAAAAGSTGTLSFYDCLVDTGTGVNNVGWRLGHVGGGGSDISFVNWSNCFVSAEGGSVPAGTRGWINEGSNSLQLNWFGGGCYYMAKGFTNLSDTGATDAQGGGTQFFHGWGTSHNLVDFEQANNSTMTIFGGRFEQGVRFLNVTSAAGHSSVLCYGCEIDAYNNGSSAIINFARPGTLILDGCMGTSWTPSNSSAINLDGFSAFGAMHIRGGAYEVTGKFWVTTGDIWKVHVMNVGLFSGGATVAYLPNRVTNAQSGTAYTALWSDSDQVIEMNNASANTMTIPPNSTTAFTFDTTLEVYNAGAGTCTVTAGAGVTIRGTATLAQFATGRFRKRGTNEWVRVS